MEEKGGREPEEKQGDDDDDDEEEEEDDDDDDDDDAKKPREKRSAVGASVRSGRRTSAERTRLLAALHRQKRRRLEDEERRCEELYSVRRAALKSALSRFDGLQRRRRRCEADRVRRFAEDDGDDALRDFIPDVEVRDLLRRFSTAGLCRLRLIRRQLDGSWLVLAVVVSNDPRRRFFLPRNLHDGDGGSDGDESGGIVHRRRGLRWPRCDLTRYEKGDCAGYLSAASTVLSSSSTSSVRPAASDSRRAVSVHYALDDLRPHDVPSDMLAIASPPRRLWLASFLSSYSRLALSNSPLFSIFFASTSMSGVRRRDLPESATTENRGISRRLVSALVASRQVALFCASESRRHVPSLSDIERANRRLTAHFRAAVVAPHIERFLAAYSRTPFARLLQVALEESLPVARWNRAMASDHFSGRRGGRRFEGEEDEEDDVDRGRRCALSGASRDLVSVVFAKCPFLEWLAEGSFPVRGSFADHLQDFAAEFRTRQRRWSRDFFAGGSSRSTGGGGSGGGGSADREGRDYGGFLLHPWKDSTLLERSVANKLMHCW